MITLLRLLSRKRLICRLWIFHRIVRSGLIWWMLSSAPCNIFLFASVHGTSPNANALKRFGATRTLWYLERSDAGGSQNLVELLYVLEGNVIEAVSSRFKNVAQRAAGSADFDCIKGAISWIPKKYAGWICLSDGADHCRASCRWWSLCSTSVWIRGILDYSAWKPGAGPSGAFSDHYHL